MLLTLSRSVMAYSPCNAACDRLIAIATSTEQGSCTVLAF